MAWRGVTMMVEGIGITDAGRMALEGWSVMGKRCFRPMGRAQPYMTGLYEVANDRDFGWLPKNLDCEILVCVG
jgi:hypothetical protein